MDIPTDIKRFLEYWVSLQVNGELPKKRDFRPQLLTDLLPNIVIVSLDHKGEPIMRLSGENANEYAGKNLGGKPYREYLEINTGADEIENIINEITLVCTDSYGMIGKRSAVLKHDRRHVGLEFLWLPFAESKTDKNAAFLLLVFEKGINISDIDELPCGDLDYIYKIDLGYGLPDIPSIKESLSISEIFNN